MASDKKIVISEHARAQALRRAISDQILMSVVRAPEQRSAVRSGRELRQSRIAMPTGGTLYLVRVVVDVTAAEDTIVTVYRTTKIRKYWSET